MLSIARFALDSYRQLRLRGLGDRRSWRRLPGGVVMEIDPADGMDRSFYVGTYDPWLLALVRAVVRPGDTVIDIGAHKGYVALHCALRVGPTGHVFAFEPDPRARTQFERHRDRNGLRQISIYGHALGREAGTLEFALSEHLGWSSFFPNREAREVVARTVGVPVKSLDAMIAERELPLEPARLSFVKIDAEGAEPLILQGMARLLADSSPTLWIEVNRGSLEAGGFGVADVERPLRDAGYGLYLPVGRRRLIARELGFRPLASLADVRGPVFDVVASRRDPAPRPE